MALVTGFNGSLTGQTSSTTSVAEEIAAATRYLAEGVVDMANATPALIEGKVYVSSTTGGGFTQNYIYVASNGGWVEALPTEGTEIYDRATDTEYVIGADGSLGAGGSGTTTTVTDNLVSTSAAEALSANQGGVLDRKKLEIPVEVDLNNDATAALPTGQQSGYTVRFLNANAVGTVLGAANQITVQTGEVWAVRQGVTSSADDGADWIQVAGGIAGAGDLLADGTVAMAADFDLGGNNAVNLADGTNDSDAATFGQVKAIDNRYLAELTLPAGANNYSQVRITIPDATGEWFGPMQIAIGLNDSRVYSLNLDRDGLNNNTYTLQPLSTSADGSSGTDNFDVIVNNINSQFDIRVRNGSAAAQTLDFAITFFARLASDFNVAISTGTDANTYPDVPAQFLFGAGDPGAGDFLADGSVPLAGDLDAGGNKLTNLAVGTNPADAVTKQQLDDGLSALGTVEHEAADIAARDILDNTTLSVGDNVFVDDASGDATVDTGWAIYKVTAVTAVAPATFRKIHEQEGLDVELKTTLNAWAATTDYAAGQLVEQAHRILKAKAGFTSGAAFDVTEATNWECVGQTSWTVWAPSTIYIESELVRYQNRMYRCSVTFTSAADFNVGNFPLEFNGEDLSDWAASTRYEVGQLIKRNDMILQRAFQLPGGGVSEATFDTTEAARWIVLSQSAYSGWAQNQVYVVGEKILVNGEIYSRNSSGSDAGTDFFLHAADWTLIEGETDYTGYTDRLLSGLKDASTGVGYRYRAGDYDEQIQGYAYLLTDADSTNASEHEIDLDARSWDNGDTYQVQLTLAESALSNHVIEVGYKDDGGNLATRLVNIGTGNIGTVIGGSVVGNLTLAPSVATVNRGRATLDVEVNLVLSWVGASGANPKITVKPTYNTDGTNTEDVTAIGETTVVRTKAGAVSDFPSASDISATLIDSSAGVVVETLPAATGSGSVLFYANRAIANSATLAVQVGESLNNTTDGTFLFSNYAAATQFRVDDIGPGEWAVSVAGAAIQLDKPYARLELEHDSAIAQGFTDPSTMTVSIGANQVVPSLIPLTRVRALQGGMTTTLSDSTSWTDGNAANQLVSGNTGSSIVVPKTSTYLVKYNMPNVIDSSIDGGDDPLLTISINGTEQHYTPHAGGSALAGDLLLNLDAGDRVQMGFVVFNLDNAENVELSPTLDEDDANLPNTANMVYGVLEVEEFVKQETVLAGMVTPTSIERANLQYSTSLQIADGANVPVGAGSTTSNIVVDEVLNTVTFNKAGEYFIVTNVGANDSPDDAFGRIELRLDGVTIGQSYLGVSDGSGNDDSKGNATITAIVPISAGKVLSKVWVREGGTSTSIGIQSCSTSIFEIPASTVVMPDALPVEDTSQATYQKASAQSIVAGTAVSFETNIFEHGTGITSDGAALFTLAQGGVYELESSAIPVNIGTSGTTSYIWHDVTAGQNIGTSGRSSAESTSNASNPDLGARATVDTNAGPVQVELRIITPGSVVAQVLSGDRTWVKFHQIASKTVTSIRATDAEFFPPTDYTPTLHATITNPVPDASATILGTYSGIVGPDSGDKGMLDINIQYAQTVSGSAGSGAYFFGLPPGFAVDPDYIEALDPDPEDMRAWGVLTHATDNASNTNQNGEIHLIENVAASASGLAMSAHANTDGSLSRLYVTSAFYTISTATTELKLIAKVPVVRL